MHISMFSETSEITTMISAHITLLDPFNKSLQQVEELLAAQTDGTRSDLEMALSRLIGAGGKRIRPTITLLIGSLLGADHKPLLFLAASIEMLHTASLIHDDLIDGAFLRRGMETLNTRWSPAASVLAGDLALTRSSKLILSTASLPVIGMFNETMDRMVDGEITQLARTQGATTREEYYDRIKAKTASMFELAAGAAAWLSPVDDEVKNIVCIFGHKIGMAFQIMDDILDFTGEQTTLGKPVGNDLRQRTITLPALIYLETHPNNLDLHTLINRGPIDKHNLDRLIVDIRRSEAIGQSLAIANNFLRDSLEALEILPQAPERQALVEIAISMVERNA
jgi:geranylgeranyl pyrophosphate synthase